VTVAAEGHEERKLFGLTTPLFTNSAGQKMGKTVGGAVWLNADALSPFDYWQYWRNTEDGDVGRFMRLFTDLPLDQIERYEALQGAEINDAKKALADVALNAATKAGASYADVRIGRYLNQFITTRDLNVENVANTESAGVGYEQGSGIDRGGAGVGVVAGEGERAAPRLGDRQVA
jgi:tyrosyl-tRNA synthetase